MMWSYVGFPRSSLRDENSCASSLKILSAAIRISMGEAGENGRLPGCKDRIAESPGGQLMLMLPGNWGIGSWLPGFLC